MIFRVTDKLARKIKTGSLAVLPPAANLYTDWTARLFIYNRSQYVLVTNTTSLYSIVLYGRGISDEQAFISHVLRHMEEFLKDQGHEFIWYRFIAPNVAESTFSKTFSRQVTGSMNDLEFQAKVIMDYHQVSLHELSVRLNKVPLSMLNNYNRPCDAFPKMVASNRAL